MSAREEMIVDIINTLRAKWNLLISWERMTSWFSPEYVFAKYIKEYIEPVEGYLNRDIELNNSVRDLLDYFKEESKYISDLREYNNKIDSVKFFVKWTDELQIDIFVRDLPNAPRYPYATKYYQNQDNTSISVIPCERFIRDIENTIIGRNSYDESNLAKLLFDRNRDFFSSIVIGIYLPLCQHFSIKNAEALRKLRQNIVNYIKKFPSVLVSGKNNGDIVTSKDMKDFFLTNLKKDILPILNSISSLSKASSTRTLLQIFLNNIELHRDKIDENVVQYTITKNTSPKKPVYWFSSRISNDYDDSYDSDASSSSNPVQRITPQEGGIVIKIILKEIVKTHIPRSRPEAETSQVYVSPVIAKENKQKAPLYARDSVFCSVASTPSSSSSTMKKEVISEKLAESEDFIPCSLFGDDFEALENSSQPLCSIPENELECPITHEIMIRPVVCSLDGCTYEYEAILEALRRDRRSPMNRKALDYGQKPEDVLTDNRLVKRLIEISSVNAHNQITQDNKGKAPLLNPRM